MTFIAKRGHASSFLIDALSASKLDDVLVHMRNPLSDSNAPFVGVSASFVWWFAYGLDVACSPRVIAMTR